MSKESKNWFSRHKILTAIIAVVGLVVIIGMASGGDNSGNGGSGGSSNSAKEYRFADRADKQETDVEFAVGESGTVGGVKLTVSSAEYKTSLGEFDNAADGKTFIVVNVGLENTSDRTKPYNEYDFRVQTAGGQVLDPTIALTDTLSSGDIVTGGKVSGDIVFEVPVEDGHQYLIWKPGLDSDRAIVELQ